MSDNLNCEGCDTPMWLEGQIDDDIPLCHPCYLSYAESGELEKMFPSSMFYTGKSL